MIKPERKLKEKGKRNLKKDVQKEIIKKMTRKNEMLWDGNLIHLPILLFFSFEIKKTKCL